MKTALLFGALAGASASLAHGREPETSRVVRYEDLDLASAAGVRTLDRRIMSTVKQLCGPMSDADPAGKNKVRRCRADTLEQAQIARRRVIEARRNAAAEEAYAENWTGAQEGRLHLRASPKPD